MGTMRYKVLMPEKLNITVRSEDDRLWATVEEFPGVFATGDDLEELRESLEEGISLYLASPNGPTPTVRLASLTPQPATTVASAELAFA